MTTARLAASRALLEVTERRATLGTAIDTARQSLGDSRDRALALELAAGTLRWQRALDEVIVAASRRQTSDIDPVALAVLRIGAYQVRYLDRIPHHAIVSESVETARALGAHRATGFVNAVLRTMIRRGAAISLPAAPKPGTSREAEIRYLSITLSHPQWLVERWLDRLGYEATESWCRWNNTPPAVTVRSLDRLDGSALRQRLADLGIEAQPAPFVDDAVRLPAGALGRMDGTLRERLWVQDEGAQLVARAAGVVPGERVLDVCASPGGKSLVMIDDLGPVGGVRGTVVAADFRPARVSLLARTLRDRHAVAPIVRLDARQPLPFSASFDCVLVDVPCSGLGTLGRDPDLKWTRTAEELPALAAAELVILRQAAEVVRPGGRLVYATCSSEPEENEAVVEAFLVADPRFSECPVGDRVPAALRDPRGRLSTRPDRDNLDAFFAATLVRRSAT